MSDRTASQLLHAALTHHHAGRLAQAEADYQQVLHFCPDHVAALDGLGAIALQERQWQLAADLIGRAMALAPSAGMACNLGMALSALGRTDAALASYRQALALEPALPEAHLNLGVLWQDQGRWDAAEACYRAALQARPHYADALDNLGSVLNLLGQLGEARTCFEQAVALRPQHAPSHNNLGNLLRQLGLLEESIASYRRGLDCDPGYEVCYSNMLLAMSHAEQTSAESMADASREYGRRFADPLRRRRRWNNTRDPERRLRIGYVSADLRAHAVSFFLAPLLAAHDRSQFELYAYANQASNDVVTEQLRAQFDHWRSIVAMDDERAAELIESDQIDILVDLSGHTAGQRLLVFARKPAPLQVTWLGFPATTGVSAIDYRLTDPYGDPPGLTEHLYSETLLRLPAIFCCYRPPDSEVAPAQSMPCAAGRLFTFGCLNNFAKVTDNAIGVWSRLLMAVPGSRLLLEIRGVDEGPIRAAVEHRFAACGIAADRLMLVPRAPCNQYVLYREIDLALDPFPCNGGTTSFDALWMGVPFVAMAGRHFAARMGVTILHNMALGELVADDEDHYVRIATGLAQDRLRLQALRAGLRERFLASPLVDGAAFGAQVDAAFRHIWRQWCAQQ